VVNLKKQAKIMKKTGEKEKKTTKNGAYLKKQNQFAVR